MGTGAKRTVHQATGRDVVNGLSFFDEDTRIKVATAIDPLMRDVAETAKSYVPGNTGVLS